VGLALSKDPAIKRNGAKDVQALVFSENIARRHLSPGRLAMVAEKMWS